VDSSEGWELSRFLRSKELHFLALIGPDDRTLFPNNLILAASASAHLVIEFWALVNHVLAKAASAEWCSIHKTLAGSGMGLLVKGIPCFSPSSIS